MWRCDESPALTSGSGALAIGTLRPRLAPHSFWGRRDGVGVNADRSHHRESEHDERHVAPPAVPRARLVVIEAEFVLGRLKAVFDRPAMTLDFRELFDGRSLGRPGREESEVAVGDLAADQQAARPDLAFEGLAVLASLEIGEFDIGPIMQALALRSLARRKSRPRGRRQTISDLLRRSGDELRLAPGMKRLRG